MSIRQFLDRSRDELRWVPLQLHEMNAAIDAARQAHTSSRTPALRFDISATEPDEIRDLLSSLMPTTADVIVVWPADRLGVRMRYGAFARNYDDLWYPARDEVWVLGPNEELIEISHEEVLTVYRS